MRLSLAPTTCSSAANLRARPSGSPCHSTTATELTRHGRWTQLEIMEAQTTHDARRSVNPGGASTETSPPSARKACAPEKSIQMPSVAGVMAALTHVAEGERGDAGHVACSLPYEASVLCCIWRG